MNSVNSLVFVVVFSTLTVLRLVPVKGASLEVKSAIITTEAFYNDDGVQEYDDDYQNDDSGSSTTGDKLLDHLSSLFESRKNDPIVKHVSNLNETMIIVDHLVDLATTLIHSKIDQQHAMSLMMDLFYNVNVTNNCFISLTKIVRGIFAGQIWALKFLDAFGKIPTGIAEGSMSHFGEYDECLEIEHHDSLDPFVETIYGRYCLAKFILPYPPLIKPNQIKMINQNEHRHYDYIEKFLQLYNLDNYLTMNKFVELLNNQQGVILRMGVCFPNVCRDEEFESLLNRLVYPIINMPIELKPDCYDLVTSKPYDRYEITAIIIISMLLLVNIVCTLCHCFKLWMVSKDDDGHDGHFGEDGSFSSRSLLPWIIYNEWIFCFSMIRNTRALFEFRDHQHYHHPINMEENSNRQDDHGQHDQQPALSYVTRDRFKCIDVIRLFLVINVCIDHMFLFPPFMSFMSFKRILNSVITKVYYYNKYFFARNIIIIDALFIISLLRKLALTQGQLQYWIFLIRLWLKYSLPMFFVVLFFWLLPRIGDGPIWNIGMSMLVPACKEPDSLLSSFAYLSNYRIRSNQNVFSFDQRFALVSSATPDSGSSDLILESTKQCNPPTWFLSALFQLQMLGPMFILLIYRHAKLGLTLNILIVLFGCYTSVSPDLLFGQKTYFDGPTISSLEEMTKAFVAYHMGINQYVISFFIGVIIGYLIIRQQLTVNQKQQQQPSNHIWLRKSVLWTVSIISLSGVMYWFNTLHRINQAPSRVSVLLWFSFGKLIGCLSFGWMLYALCIGQASFIEKIFSLSLFRFLSRLTFGIYLLHFLPLANRLFTVRDTYVMTDKLLFEFILIDFIQTSFMASIFYVIIERPFNNLTSMIFLRMETVNTIKNVQSSSSLLSSSFPQQTPSLSGLVQQRQQQQQQQDSCCNQQVHDNYTVDEDDDDGGGVGGGKDCNRTTVAASMATIKENNKDSFKLSSLTNQPQHPKMIRIEIQDLKLSLPQINLFAANCGDYFHYHHHHQHHHPHQQQQQPQHHNPRHN